METSIGDATCILDRDGRIVWASPAFVELFSHRAAPIGMVFNQLFSGLTDVCRHGTQLEDRDRLGRKRYFSAECQRMSNARGDRVSDILVLRNVTLMKTLTDLARLSTPAKTPRELFEKALSIVKDTYGYLGLAGFVARDGGPGSPNAQNLELVASKGWTEKLKSMIRVVPIAPDAPAMAGRCAYHRQQMVTTIGEYGLMKTVKNAIERIGGEFVVVTPLIDHERLVGVLTVIHGRALSPEELETLQTVGGQLAVSLAVLVHEEELSGRAEDATLFVDLLSHEIAMHGAIIKAWGDDPADERARESAMKAMALNDEAVRDIDAIRSSGRLAGQEMPLAAAIDRAVEDARLAALQAGKKINVTQKLAGSVSVGVLFRYALRNLLVNSVKHAAARAVDVDVRSSVDRSGAYKIEVSDNGPGIPDEMKSEVFRREASPGRGAELCLVKRIVNRYGGRVWIEDRVPGNPAKGARVVILLPPAAR